MKILALETSGTFGGVAALDGDRLLAALSLDRSIRTARSLAPGMRDVLRAAGWSARDVELVAVAAGPGSFTGLRLGVTTAKTFAYAVGCKLLGINTLEVIAAQAPAACEPLHVIVDAQRQQVFASTRTDAPAAPSLAPTQVLAIDDWLRELSSGAWVTGPMLARLAERLPRDVNVVDPALWTPTAESVARLAWRHYQAGRRDDVFQLVPQYYRRSAAEEKAAANQAP